ncbi:hypothetical protein ACX80W_05785 [Arthrobacter sp. TMN-37]
MTETPNGRGQDDGAGPEGTIPDSADGIGATTLDEPSNFEPEEDDVDTESGEPR